MQTDRIWPPNLVTYGNSNILKFIRCLKLVLERLPEEGIDLVENKISFVIDYNILAINVPIFSTNEKLSHVYITGMALKLDKNPLIDLLAQEIAHSFSENPTNHLINEKLADETAVRWGFAKELNDLKTSEAKKSMNHT